MAPVPGVSSTDSQLKGDGNTAAGHTGIWGGRMDEDKEKKRKRKKRIGN